MDQSIATTKNACKNASRQTEPGTLPSSKRYSSGFGKDESYYYCSAQGCNKTFNSLEEVQSHMRNHGVATSQSDSLKNPQQRFSARLRARSIRQSDEKKLKESEAAEVVAAAAAESVVTPITEDIQKVAGRKRALEVESSIIKLSKIKKISSKLEEKNSIENKPADKESPSLVKSSNRSPRFRQAKISGECPICCRTFLSKTGLWIHLQYYKISELRCDKCCLVFDKHESLMMHVLDSHLTKKDKPPSEAPSVLNNRDQNEVQPSEPTKVEEKAPVEKEAENLEIKSVEAESPAPTVVEPQEQPVEIPISDTKEKVVVRPKRFKKSEFVSGFDDLAQYEFSTPLFPLVAEMLCTNNPHLLNDRDGLYVFHCKICDLMFPKLDVLDFHFTRKHMDVYETLKSGSPSTLEQNIVVESKDSKVQDVDETPVAMSESEDTPPDEFLALLKLERKGVRDAKLETKKLENAQTPKTFGITYGMNNEYFYTSPAPGYHRQPSWMRNDDSGTITIPDKRYFAPVSAQTPSSAPNTNQMIELYGIKVAVDDNGKRTYRCRICTYDSHEKSTIVRHQRTHTGIRPFTCSNCKYSFTTKANCERHIKKRHADILKRERCDAKSLVESNDEQIKRLREGGYGLRDPNFISNGTNVRQRHRPFNSKCLICLMIFSSHAACVKHLARDHNVPEDKAAGKLANILPSASDTPMSISPTMISKDADEFNNFAQCLSAESDNMDYTSGNSTPVPNYQRQELEARLKSVLQTGDDRKSSTGTGIWKRRSIIPLAQVEAFNDATKKLREYFERDYAAVIDSTINNTDYEGVHSVRRLNSKFSSLLTAASCQIVRSKRKRTLSRTIHSAPYNRLRPQQPLFKSSFPNSRHNNFRPIKPKLLREDNYKESPSSSSMAGVAHQSTSETSQSCTEAHIEATDSQASNIVASSIFNSDYAQLYKNLLFANDSCPSINGQSEANSVERTTTSQTGYNDSLSTIEKSVNQSQQQQQQPILGNSTNEAQDDTGVNESTESLMKDTEECNEAASPSTSLKVSTFRMNLLNNMKKNLMMNSKGNRHGSSYMLPTMVDINKKNLVYLSDAVVGTNGEHSDKRFSQPRKCPKCVKTFPWASSLRRHIMTHTGLKPHMCSLCNMRFTTRSNLLRHAYRRHQIDRNSVERQNIVISLSPEEQQRFAEEEARVLVESNQEAAVEQVNIKLQLNNH